MYTIHYILHTIYYILYNIYYIMCICLRTLEVSAIWPRAKHGIRDVGYGGRAAHTPWVYHTLSHTLVPYLVPKGV